MAEARSRVVGEERAAFFLWMVAIGEMGLGAWMLAGTFLTACLTIQTVFIATMNALELRHARDLLLSPLGMVAANVVFLSLGWYVALAPP